MLGVVSGFAPEELPVVDGLCRLDVRLPRVANESPTLGLSHLQFEALLTAARDSDNRFDFALMAMLGLLELRIFDACRSDIADVDEEQGHRVLRVIDKGPRSPSSPARPPDNVLS